MIEEIPLLFGFYPKPFQKEFRKVELQAAIASFRSARFKSLLSPCQTLYRENKIQAYSLYKKQLPAFTFSGTFSPERNANNINQYSGLIILDVDKLSIEELIAKKSLLKNDNHVLAVWTSPSGAGLKFLIYSSFSHERHKEVYRSAIIYFQERYNLIIDKSGSDLSRLCFVSYDPDVTIKSDFIPFALVVKKEELRDVKIITPDYTRSKIVRGELCEVNNKRDKETVKKIYHFLKKRNLSITDCYENWVKVAFAISSAFTYNVARHLFLNFCRLDKEKHDENLSEKLLSSCYTEGAVKSSFPTIIYLAKQKGYIPNYNEAILGSGVTKDPLNLQ